MATSVVMCRREGKAVSHLICHKNVAIGNSNFRLSLLCNLLRSKGNCAPRMIKSIYDGQRQLSLCVFTLYHRIYSSFNLYLFCSWHNKAGMSSAGSIFNRASILARLFSTVQKCNLMTCHKNFTNSIRIVFCCC